MLFCGFATAQTNKIDSFNTKNGKLTIEPVLHASFIMNYNNTVIYIDPAGNPELFKGKPAPDLIIITDIHRDHLDETTLNGIDVSKSIFILPQDAADKIDSKYKSKLVILKNDQGIHRLGFFIKAIPMYNLTEERKKFHAKGRGNGYVIEIDGKNIYISGDTEDIPEMRQLQNIDIAFVCMNLPYTMDINQAASAVLNFNPKVVYPYHYRGTNGISDVQEFKKLIILKNKNIDVRLKNWYPTN